MIGLTVATLTGEPHPGLRTDCGVRRLSDGKACGAYNFIQAECLESEARTDGRSAESVWGEEAFFGVAQQR